MQRDLSELASFAIYHSISKCLKVYLANLVCDRRIGILLLIFESSELVFGSNSVWWQSGLTRRFLSGSSYTKMLQNIPFATYQNVIWFFHKVYTPASCTYIEWHFTRVKFGVVVIIVVVISFSKLLCAGLHSQLCDRCCCIRWGKTQFCQRYICRR